MRYRKSDRLQYSIMIGLLLSVWLISIISISIVQGKVPDLSLEATKFYNIGSWQRLESFQTDSLEVDGVKFLPPWAPTWSRAIEVSSTQRAIIIWDGRKYTLDAIFCKYQSTTWKVKGVDRLSLQESDPFFGSGELEKPLLPPNNLQTTDTLFSSFGCLDRSKGGVRYYSLDFNTYKLKEDSVKMLGFRRGQPWKAVYLKGDKNGNGAGITVFRPLSQTWEWFPSDTTDTLHFRLADHSGLYHYRIGNTTPTAFQDTLALTFLMFDPIQAVLYNFHSTYGDDVVEPDWTPRLLEQYPLMPDWGKLTHDGINLMTYSNMSGFYFFPLDVDKEGRIWIGCPKEKLLFVIANTDFPHGGVNSKDYPIHSTADFPSCFGSTGTQAIAIDASIRGYITIITSKGIETFTVIEN